MPTTPVIEAEITALTRRVLRAEKAMQARLDILINADTEYKACCAEFYAARLALSRIQDKVTS